MKHMCRFILLALFMVLIVARPAGAETIVTGISDTTVSIESNFTGAELVVFGNIERDAQTVARRQGHDVVVIVRGPQRDITVRQKDRVLGIWANRYSRTFRDTYGFLSILSNRPFADIATPALLDSLELGLMRQQFASDQSGVTFTGALHQEFIAAFVRQMKARELFTEVEDGVTFLSKTLFVARIAVPAFVPVGDFKAEVLLFADGALLNRQEFDLKVQKSGFEQIAFTVATQYPFLYGLLAVFLALVGGWLASVIFKRD